MPCEQNVITSWNREEQRQTQGLGLPIATDINIVETLAKESEPLQSLNQAGRVDQPEKEITDNHSTDDETSPIIPEEQPLIRVIKNVKELMKGSLAHKFDIQKIKKPDRVRSKGRGKYRKAEKILQNIMFDHPTNRERM